MPAWKSWPTRWVPIKARPRTIFWVAPMLRKLQAIWRRWGSDIPPPKTIVRWSSSLWPAERRKRKAAGAFSAAKNPRPTCGPNRRPSRAQLHRAPPRSPWIRCRRFRGSATMPTTCSPITSGTSSLRYRRSCVGNRTNGAKANPPPFSLSESLNLFGPQMETMLFPQVEIAEHGRIRDDHHLSVPGPAHQPNGRFGREASRRPSSSSSPRQGSITEAGFLKTELYEIFKGRVAGPEPSGIGPGGVFARRQKLEAHRAPVQHHEITCQNIDA